MSDSDVKYPHNVLEGFGLGAMLDLRVRFAHDYLMHSPIFRGMADAVNPGKPESVADYALDLADALLTQGAARGWVTPLPTDTELDPQLRAQAKRTASFQALQQIEGQKFVQDEAGRVIPTRPTLVS